jgi:replicative DNA helicase Mcm
MPLSLKQAESLSKLAKANALLNNKPIADKKDALEAIKILEYCLQQIGFDKATKKIDIDRIETEFPASVRTTIKVVSEAILDLENKIGKTIPIEDILEHKMTKGIDEIEIDDAIESLKRKGQIFEPREGFISRI